MMAGGLSRGNFCRVAPLAQYALGCYTGGMRVAKEGFPFILIPFAAGVALVVAQNKFVLQPAFAIAGIIFLLASLFCLFFFRDPDISITRGENLVLSPCNGTVLQIDENESAVVIRVFLSIFNVHLQRAPVAGTVRSVEHKDGKFLMAWDPTAHEVNEQNIITIENQAGVFVVKQIAGFLARRCVAWVRAGDTLGAGEQIGLIKFSSQVDLYIPKNVTIKIEKGDKVIAGVTVFGEIT
jgi:phosphatidylserine decarboxylase